MQLHAINALHSEFVPSVHAFFVDETETVGGSITRCYLTAASKAAVDAKGNEWSNAGSTLCELKQDNPNKFMPLALDRQLARTIALLEVRPQYLFLANEPFASAARTPTPRCMR